MECVTSRVNIYLKRNNLASCLHFTSEYNFFSVNACQLGCQPASLLTTKRKPDAILAVSSSVSRVSSLRPAPNPSSIKDGVCFVVVNDVSTVSLPLRGSGALFRSLAHSRLCKKRCYVGDSSEDVEAVNVQPCVMAALRVLTSQCQGDCGGSL